MSLIQLQLMYLRVFGPHATSQEVYEVAAKPVVKATMEGVNGTVFTYGVTSSGKTHTNHGDQNAPGIIPLAIKDVISIIQDTPGQEFLLRMSYLEIYNEMFLKDVIIREHVPISNLFTCLWFHEVDRFTSRDQISFSTVRDKIAAKTNWTVKGTTLSFSIKVNPSHGFKRKFDRTWLS